MSNAEALLQMSVVEALEWSLTGGAFVFATLGERKVSRQTGARLNRMGRLTGIADLGVVHDGRIFWIELKTEKGPGVSRGYQTKEQRDFEAMARLAGSPYAVCRSLAEVEAFLRARGVPMRARST